MGSARDAASASSTRCTRPAARGLRSAGLVGTGPPPEGAAVPEDRPVSQRFEAHVQFICPRYEAHASTAVDVPEPDWGEADRMLNLNSEGETEVQCPVCASLFEAYVINSAGDCDVTLKEHPETHVSADTAFYSPEEDDWTDFVLPDDPFSIWKESFEQAQAYLEAHGLDDGGALLNRMVFSQHVAALEAFLGDTLLKAVLADPKPLGRLLAGDKELTEEKFTLAEIEASPQTHPRSRQRLSGGRPVSQPRQGRCALPLRLGNRGSQ